MTNIDLNTPEEYQRDADDLEMLRLTSEGWTRQEVADHLGVTKGVIIGRLDRIRKAAKKHR